MSLASAETAAESPGEVEFLSMSDDEFSAMDLAFLDTEANEDGEANPAAIEEEGEVTAAESAEDDSAEDDDAEDLGDDDQEDLDDGDDAADPDVGADDVDSADTDDDGDADPDGEDADTVDYKAEYEKLLAPFKANGAEKTVKNADEAIRLMQMGANYNYKMAALKPSLKILKTLEKAGIDEGKLNELIDLDRKDPAAIARLVKAAGIDPVALDVDAQAEEYKVTDHSVNDVELELDSVLEELRETPEFDGLIEVVGSKWDETSKQIVANTPQLLNIIHTHMRDGVFDVISTKVDSERMFGRLSGMSDLDAYKTVGDALHAEGAFEQLYERKSPAPEPKAKGPDTPPAAKADRKDKRRAASPPKPASEPSGPAKGFNPLALSDEEFERQYDSNLL